jgi:hypothetical protein
MQCIEEVDNETDLIAKGHVTLWCHTRNFPFESEIHLFEVQVQKIYGNRNLIYSSYRSCFPNICINWNT